MTTVTAEPFGDRLMRFAIDRAIETHSLRTQLETSAPASQARSSATAALSAATAWEAAMLWVAWRLRGRRLLAG